MKSRQCYKQLRNVVRIKKKNGRNFDFFFKLRNVIVFLNCFLVIKVILFSTYFRPKSLINKSGFRYFLFQHKSFFFFFITIPIIRIAWLSGISLQFRFWNSVLDLFFKTLQLTSNLFQRNFHFSIKLIFIALPIIRIS